MAEVPSPDPARIAEQIVARIESGEYVDPTLRALDQVQEPLARAYLDLRATVENVADEMESWRQGAPNARLGPQWVRALRAALAGGSR